MAGRTLGCLQQSAMNAFVVVAIVVMAIQAGARPMFEHSRDRPAVVVLAQGASPAEATAAQEVTHYLHAITGVSASIQNEPGPATAASRVYVGPTVAAAKAGISVSSLGPEEWTIRTIGSDLYLVGGLPRGTLYAVYHFLEDVLGVRWWTPWDESVPKKRSVRVGKLRRQGKPAFEHRDIYMLYGADDGRFAARNRLNREGDSPIQPRYGGGNEYGPPYHVHTAYQYFPPAEYFASHPDWYSLIDGKRTFEKAQLCWTNPGLREAFRQKLQETIRKSWGEARAAGQDPPLVFSVSQNDWGGPCQCEPCQALAKSEGSEAGPLLDFVNAMADAVRTEWPQVFIETLAYDYTQKAPQTIRPRDNVVIRLCDTQSNMLAPLSAPENQAFREHLHAWSRLAKHLRVWDYAVTYNPPGMPLPTIHTYGPDLRYYLAHGVKGVFVEMEYEVLADMRDLKVWVLMKLMENPMQDPQRVVDTFLSGFYGPAGMWVKRYLQELQAEATRRTARCNFWQGSPATLTYLTPDFVGRAHRLFDRAAKAVTYDPVLAQRVAHARLPLDRATLMLWPRMGEALPWLDRETVAERALRAWFLEIDRRVPAYRRAEERYKAEGEIRWLNLVPAKSGLPEPFRGRALGSVMDYTAVLMRRWNDSLKIVSDPEAETGLTVRLDLTADGVEHPERYGLPMPWGVYLPDEKRVLETSPIKAADIPGPGYHWYKLGDFSLAPSAYVWFFWSWILQVEIGNTVDPRDSNARYEIWARIKFEGPRFPHARPGQADAICVERVIVARTR